MQREPAVKLDTGGKVKSGTVNVALGAWRCLPLRDRMSTRSVPAENARQRAGIGRALLVLPQNANHASQRLNPLAGKGSTNFRPDDLGSLVAKLFRRECLNLL